MKVNNDFIIQQIIMPNMKPAYKIIFVDSQQLDNHQYFNGLSYEERSLLKPYFMEIGGHWSEVHKSFVFIKEVSTWTIKEAIQKANNQNPLSKEQIEREKLQAYFTPLEISKKMQQLAHICDKDIVLDPSAGTGNLVNGLNIPKENIFLVEPHPEFCEFLRRSGYVNVIQSTFEDALDKRVLPNNISKILMNPPFSKQSDLKHILLAYELLNKGGTLVSIIGKNSLLERDINNQKSPTLKNFISTCKSSKFHQIINLEPASFEESGTICDTCMIILEKERVKELDNLHISSNIDGEERE